jgi:histidyl-tRNA synthetase
LGPWADAVLQAIEAQATNARLREVLDRLAALGLRDFVEVDLRIVRGLAYYTGVVFEVHDRARQFRAIAGGGRYDGLVELVSGVKLPALGFGMGDVVILELLKDLGKLPKLTKRPGLFLVISDEAWRDDALRLAGALRKSGYAVEYSLAPAKVGKQFQTAEEKGAQFALIVDAQIKEGRCGLKDLSARRQEDVAFQIADGRVTFQPALPLAPDES